MCEARPAADCVAQLLLGPQAVVQRLMQQLVHQVCAHTQVQVLGQANLETHPTHVPRNKAGADGGGLKAWKHRYTCVRVSLDTVVLMHVSLTARLSWRVKRVCGARQHMEQGHLGGPPRKRCCGAVMHGARETCSWLSGATVAAAGTAALRRSMVFLSSRWHALSHQSFKATMQVCRLPPLLEPPEMADHANVLAGMAGKR